MNRVWRMAGMLCICAAVLVVISSGFAGEAEGTQEPAIVQQPTVPPPVYGESLEPQRIVVTATRIPTPIENVPSSVTAFTSGNPGGPGGNAGGRLADGQYSAGNFEARQYRNLSDALQNVPGLTMYTSGGLGSLSNVFMRGLDGGNTQILVDGMVMNDPSTSDGSFNFGQFTLDNIGQLEVMRGPQSVLYGSAATGGVINLTSKKGEGPASGYVSTEAGSRGTILTRLGASAGNDKGDFSIGGSVFHTDGYSRADKHLPGNSERDGFEYGSANMRLGWNATESLRFDLFSNLMKSEVEYDAAGGEYGDDDSNKRSRVERYMLRPQATLSLFDGRWEQIVGVGYAQTYRREWDDDFMWRSKFRGETYKFDYQSIIRLHETNTLLAGVDVVTESVGKYDPLDNYTYEETDPGSVTTTSLYLEDQVNIRDTIFATLGVRQIIHDDFGEETVWKASGMYVLPTNTKIKASVGTGFKAPTLDQLYMGYPMYGYYGNPDLKPETTFGWDAGFEQSLFCDRLLFGSTFFRNKVKNKIGYEETAPWTYKTMNIERYRAWGIESFVQFALTDNLTVTAQHTWLQTEDTEGEDLLRRPEHEASINVDYRFLEKGTATVGAKFVGHRLDTDYPDLVKMSSHTIFRVGAAWKVNDHFEVFGRVENVFNKKYQQIYGYGTEGRAFYAGATLSF